MTGGLHHQIKQKAKFGAIKLNELAPNSREIALRLISEGKLIKCGSVYRWYELEEK